jgi:hypothetical protein
VAMPHEAPKGLVLQVPGYTYFSFFYSFIYYFLFFSLFLFLFFLFWHYTVVLFFSSFLLFPFLLFLCLISKTKLGEKQPQAIQISNAQKEEEEAQRPSTDLTKEQLVELIEIANKYEEEGGRGGIGRRDRKKG